MNDATKEMFNDQLSTAKILINSINNVNWDLAHYIADNALGKLMMLKLHEERIYNKNQVEGFSFPTLVNTFKTKFPSISIDYDEIKKQHIHGRNPFQHKLITNYLGIRKEQAKLYISLLKELMDIIEILNPKTDFSLGLEGSNYKISLDVKESLEFFIENKKKCIEALQNICSWGYSNLVSSSFKDEGIVISSLNTLKTNKNLIQSLNITYIEKEVKKLRVFNPYLVNRIFIYVECEKNLEINLDIENFGVDEFKRLSINGFEVKDFSEISQILSCLMKKI